MKLVRCCHIVDAHVVSEGILGHVKAPLFLQCSMCVQKRYLH